MIYRVCGTGMKETKSTMMPEAFFPLAYLSLSRVIYIFLFV